MEVAYVLSKLVNAKSKKKENCYNCFYYKSGDCNGISKICTDYIEVPEITDNEIAIWRKFGDATRFKQRKVKIYG